MLESVERGEAQSIEELQILNIIPPRLSTRLFKQLPLKIQRLKRRHSRHQLPLLPIQQQIISHPMQPRPPNCPNKVHICCHVNSGMSAKNSKRSKLFYRFEAAETPTKDKSQVG